MDFDKYKFHIIGAVILMFVLYFAHEWHVNKMIDDKLKKIERKKRRASMNEMKQKQQKEEIPNEDDSYIDPQIEDGELE